MIFIGIFILSVVILYVSGKLPTNLFVTTQKTLSESQIIKKFNKTLKSLGERNLDFVKQELIKCLDEYTIVKEEQFKFTLTQIRKSKNDINNQLNQMKSRVINAKNALDVFIAKHRGDKNLDVINEGTKLMHSYKLCKLLLDKLNTANESLYNRENELNSMLTDFNSNVAIKKAEISIMIADSTGIFTGSDIDLRLDNLVKEFQDKIIEGKASQDVHNKLNNNISDIDYSECRKEFEELIS